MHADLENLSPLCVQADMVPALSQALSHALSSEFSRTFSQPCPISIAAAPAVMDLAAASAPLVQPHPPSNSSPIVPPAVAAQQTHLGNDAGHSMPSPNYRMDHVLADSLHAATQPEHDFGPMSLASALSNDENMTPAASRDFTRVAAAAAAEQRATQQDGEGAAATPPATVTTEPARPRQVTPPRGPFWETQMTPHGQHPALRSANPSVQEPTVLPVVTPATEVNALGQPLSMQREQAGPPVATAAAVSQADVVTPPGGFQPQQVWENNIFSPEIPADRPRYAAYAVLYGQADCPASRHTAYPWASTFDINVTCDSRICSG